MRINNNTLTLDRNETENLCRMFIEKFDQREIIAQASVITPGKSIEPVYFSDIFASYTLEQLEGITGIVLDRDVCDRKLEKQINKVFRTIQKINNWANDQRAFWDDLYTERIKKRLIKSTIGGIVALIIYFFRGQINQSYNLLLFDISRFYVGFQLLAASVYYYQLRKLYRQV